MNDNQIIASGDVWKERDQLNPASFSHDNTYNNTLTNRNHCIMLKEYFNIATSRFGKDTRNIRQRFASWYKSMSLCIQVMFWYIIVLTCVGLILLFTRRWIYDNVILVDYSTGYNSKFSMGIIQENFSYGFKYINSEFNEQMQSQINQMILMKIYMKELITKSLLKGNSFENVVTTTDSYYEDIFNDDNMFAYTIDPQIANEHCIGNDTVGYLNNLVIINYLFAPLLIQEAAINKNKLVSTYLLTYYLDDIDKKQFTNMKYFNYPLYNIKLKPPTGNFNQINKLTDPDVKSDFNGDSDHVIDSNHSIRANWFYLTDYTFRQEVNDRESKCNISFFSYAELRETDVYRYHFIVLQFSIPAPESHNTSSNPLVVNLIFKYKQEYQNSRINTFSFLLQDLTFNPKADKLMKYTDKESFVITKNAIAPFAISDNHLQYFTFEMYHKDKKFYENGNNFDTFDLEYYTDLEADYHIRKSMSNDILFFKIMNFYYQITIKLALDPTLTKSIHFYYLANCTNKEEIASICDTIDIREYHRDLKNIKHLNCINDYDMYYYYYTHGMPYNTKAIGYLPHCLCVPFYCLDLNKTDLDRGVFEYTPILYLPNNCKSNYASYYSGVGSVNKGENEYVVNDIFINNNRAVFYYTPIPYLKSISLYNVNTIFNYLITEAEFAIDTELKGMTKGLIRNYFLLYFLAKIIFVVMGAFRMYNKGNLYNLFINDYKDYVFKLEKNSNSNNNNNNSSMDQEINAVSCEEENMTKKSENSMNNRVEAPEKKALINEHTSINDGVVKEDSLIDALFHFYCEFHKKRKENAISGLKSKANEGTSLETLKLKFLRSSNELFDILGWIAKVTPKYQIEFRLDFNFHTNTKIIRTYKKLNQLSDNQNAFQPFGKNSNPTIEASYTEISEAILCELKSTESLFDEGLIYNLKFNYKTTVQFSADLNHKNKNRPVKSDLIKLSEKRKDIFYEECEREFKGAELNKIYEIKSAFNYYLSKVYYDSMNYMLLNFMNNTEQVCMVKNRSNKSNRVMFNQT